MSRIYKHNRLVLLSPLLILASAVASLSQSSGLTFTITSQVVAGGGCGPDGIGGCTQSIGSGNLGLNGTVAEPGAFDLSRQPPFTVRGGFWYTTLGSAPTAANGNISGSIVDSNGNPVEGAAVRMTGTQNRLTVTDAQGNYRFDNVEVNGLYTVTPSRANFSFSPTERSFSQIGQHTDALFSGQYQDENLNPLDRTEYFVRQHYLDFLGREPDESGLNFWYNNIESCGSDQQCREVKRIDTSAAFFFSIEHQETGYLVYRIYQSAYGDMSGTPVPLTLMEFRSDAAQISQGVIVNQDGWQSVLENNKRGFGETFVERPRFMLAYPASMTPEQFVDRLLMTAGITADSLERAAIINEFGRAANSADAAARGRALRRVAENGTVQTREFNQAFVLMQYFGYLRRNPNSGPDLDFAGYNFWLEKLEHFNGNYHDAEMVKAFIVSGEYRRRFGM